MLEQREWTLEKAESSSSDETGLLTASFESNGCLHVIATNNPKEIDAFLANPTLHPSGRVQADGDRAR
jgi:hypothetical protein